MIDKIKEFIQDSQKILTTSSDQYLEYSLALKKDLEDILKQSGYKSSIVQTRVKSVDSLSEKVYRKNYHQVYDVPQEFISNLPDIIGARILCLLNIEEDKIFDSLKSYYDKYQEIDEKTFNCKDDTINTSKLFLDFTDQPQRQKNGHDIYRITCKWFDAVHIKYINVELQIKSLVHFFWGELDHMLFYKNYAYLISSGFYSDLMDKINVELENIDRQLLTLRDHIDKTDKKEVEEIKQIASLILYNKYNTDVVSNLECIIDLREVFDLLVDIHFKNTGDKQINYRRLHEVITDINGKKFNPNLISLISSGKLKESEFGQKTKVIAQTIDMRLKSQDIFWVFFYTIYGSHFLKEAEQNYNTIIKKIIDEFLLMSSVFEDDIERIDDDCEDLYDNFINEIYKGLSYAFFYNSKLSFFIYDLNLNKINHITKQIVRRYQCKISSKSREIICRNIEVISLYTQCLLIASIEKKISKKEVEKLKTFLEQEDYFEININHSYFEENFLDCSIIDEQNFLRLFLKEEE